MSHINNKVIADYSKIQWFDLKGQGQLWAIVKFTLVSLKILSKGLLCPTLKTLTEKNMTNVRIRTATTPQLRQMEEFPENVQNLTNLCLNCGNIS